MRAIHLQTEYLTEPLGLGIRKPRFYWKCEDGKKQLAYQIRAKHDGELVWDSGEVESSSMTHIPYAGKDLSSRDCVEWAVRLKDENGIWGEWAKSRFEMGLLEPSDWTAKWISGDYKPKKNLRFPVDHFKKEFRIRKKLKKARLYITACGIYEAKINGKRVGEAVLAPGCTDYRKRLQYQVYDVTGLLCEQNGQTGTNKQSGVAGQDGTCRQCGAARQSAVGWRNVLEIALADGWYRGSIGCFGLTNVFGRMTKLLCQLELEYEDGFLETVNSDDSFAWSNDGPVRFADLKDGEVYDASKVPSYSGRAKLIKETLIPYASDNVSPKEQERFAAKLLVTPSGKRVLDFGQNIAGLISFQVTGKKGQRIKLTCGEILDENEEFTQKNMQEQKPVKEFGRMTEIMLITGNGSRIKGEMQPTPRQEILFSCSGQEDFYKTSFAVFGFRYALIETEIDFAPEQFWAIAVYSDLERTGDFSCSNEKVNRLFENTLWSMKGNFLDVPTDCPTRERLGWTGDAQVFFDTGAYLMNVAPFFRKWMRDMADNQFKNGKISAVIPYNGASMLYDNTGGSVGWGDAAVLLPYRYWKRYNDLSIIQDFYRVMRGYAMFMIHNCGQKNKKAAKENPYNKYTYEKGMHLGEWLEPEEFQDKIAAGHSALHTEECTAYLHYTMRHMAEAAKALGNEEDEVLFSKYADGAKKAYCWLFFKDGTPDTDRQAKLVRPLAFGLAEGEYEEALEMRLAQAVENRGCRIATGFLSTPFVLGVLTRMGRPDLAYKMLESEEAPGWLYEVKQGATTVWENWEGTASHNHYSPGAVCQWLFDTVAGIRVSGENRFTIAPVPGGTMTYAKAGYDSIYGRVESGWEKTEDGTVQFTVTIPTNTAAEVILPDGQHHEAGCGRHVFESTEKGELKHESKL